MNFLYLALDAAVISVPLAFTWHPSLRFADRLRDFVPACLIVAAGFLAWDVLYTDLGVWGFDDRYLVGWRIAGLPIEEWLFFVCIPYACVFTYHCLGHLRPDVSWDRAAVPLSGGLLALCVILIALGPARLYTASAAGLVAVFLGVAIWRRPAWLGRLWLSFCVLVVPFVISNGVLTGIWFWEYPVYNAAPEAITNHVVWYDNVHNLGVRLLSIPFDDFLYAFALIGLNVALFEYFGRRRGVRAA